MLLLPLLASVLMLLLRFAPAAAAVAGVAAAFVPGVVGLLLPGWWIACSHAS